MLEQERDEQATDATVAVEEASYVTTCTPSRAATAAIQMSFVGTGVPAARSAMTIWMAPILGRTFAIPLLAAISTWADDLVLVTRNVRDFSGFTGLRIESWFSA